MSDKQCLEDDKKRKFESHRVTHHFTREKFIEQIKMMHSVSEQLKEKRVNIDSIDTWSDENLLKAHLYYWNGL